MKGLLDTSIFVAREQQRALGGLPEDNAVSVITIGELRLGVLMTDDPADRARRLATVIEVERALEVIPVDEKVVREFARLVAEARRAGLRPATTDALIAATAAAHGLTIYTQDADFRHFPSIDVVMV
ncbi:MAG: PIN domain-containing protein [Chloroflexota bacterium]|nr:PIN domain-containing protein [Chloroflexota bacterium]